MHKTC